MAQQINYKNRNKIANIYAQEQSDVTLIYNHIPKCGGLSLAAMLRTIFPHSADIHQNIFDPRFTPLDRDFYHGHGVSGLQTWLPPEKSFFYITFLRHPWSLAQSLIRFFSWLLPLDNHYKQSPEKLLLSQQPNILIQYLGNGNKALAEENLLHNYAFFGLQEHFSDSMTLLSEIIPKAIQISNIAKNVSHKQVWDIAPEVKEEFFEKHADDIALYEKAKHEFLRRLAEFEAAHPTAAKHPNTAENSGLNSTHSKGDNIITVQNLKESIALDEDLPAMDSPQARFENWLYILTHSMQSEEEYINYFQWLMRRAPQRLSCLYFAYLVAEKAQLPELADIAQQLFELCEARDGFYQCRLLLECRAHIVKTCLERKIYPYDHPFNQKLLAYSTPEVK